MYKSIVPGLKTAEEIKKDILSRYQTDLKKEEGNFSYDMAAPIARELENMYFKIPALIPMVWVNETSGPFLDLAAADIPIAPRKEGSKSVVILDIIGKRNRLITKGTRFATVDNRIFLTVADVVLDTDGFAQAQAEAENIGYKYNLEIGEISRLYRTDPNITSVTNKTPSSGGTDKESDKSLFARISFAKMKPETTWNVYVYERKAKEVSGVGFARVFPCWDGPNTVKVLIADENRQPVDDEIVKKAYDHITKDRAICAEITVVSAVRRTIDIHAKIETKTGVDIEGTRLMFIERANEMFSEMALWKDRVSLHRVGAVLIKTPEIQEYTELLLNGLEANIELTSDEVPSLGEVIFE